MAPRISEEAKKAKRDHLLEAALECFSSKGYYASTVDDIVRYADLSKGSVYNYFKSKEDIFIHLLEKKRTESMEHLKEKLDKIDSPTEKLKHWIHEDIPYSSDKKKFMRVHIEFWLYSADSPKLKEILSKRFDAMVNMTKAIIAEGKNCGEFRQNLDVEQATAMFWSLHDGIWLHAVIGYDVKKLESHIREMENVFMAYIEPKAESTRLKT